MSSKTPKTRQSERIDSRPWNIGALVAVLGCADCASKVYVSRDRRTAYVHHELTCPRIPSRYRRKCSGKKRHTITTTLGVELRGRG